jgi:tRNA pseudouridine38-40 synthase
VEGELNKCISDLLKREVQVIGASRTDAGVHAMGNLAVFDTDSNIPAEKFAYALNCKLPADVKVQRSVEVAADFHPRHCDSRKTYEYHIVNAPFPNPMKRLYCHFTYLSCDVAAMQEAAKYLVGEHDFKSFCTVGAQVESTVRIITDLAVTRFEDEIIIRVTGTGFLYNMVRIIAGTLLDVGYGRKKADDIPAILAALDRQAAGPTAPAQGLRLVKYDFADV